MADHHGEVEYATADGNDYAEHEGTYEAFLHLTYITVLNAISVLLGLTIGGVLGHWVVGGIVIALAAISALQGLVFNSRLFTNVVVVLGFLGLALYGLS